MKKEFSDWKERPLLVTKIQKLNNMRKDLIDSPNIFLGHTENDKNAANHHQFQEERYNWLNMSFGLCQLRSKKIVLTVGKFIEYHGNWFVFLFELNIHVRYLKPLHPNTNHHHIHLSHFQ